MNPKKSPRIKKKLRFLKDGHFVDQVGDSYVFNLRKAFQHRGVVFVVDDDKRFLLVGNLSIVHQRRKFVQCVCNRSVGQADGGFNLVVTRKLLKRSVKVEDVVAQQADARKARVLRTIKLLSATIASNLVGIRLYQSIRLF